MPNDEVEDELVHLYGLELKKGADILDEKSIEEKEREKEIYSVQNCTRENEKIIEGFSHEKPYLTTTIIKFDD